MNSIENNKKYTLIYITLIYLLVFQNLLQRYINIFQYIDEILSIIGILYFFIYLKKKKGKVKKTDLIIIISILLLTIIGFYSNINYKLQDLNYAFKDWILIVKFLFVYLFARAISLKIELKNSNHMIYKNLKIIILLLATLTILNYLFEIYPGEKRYGIMSNMLFYEHPTYLAAICVFLIANVILFSQKLNNKYIVICFIILTSTLRLKAIVASLIIILLITYINLCNKKLSIIKLGLAGIIAIVVAWSQIEYYFLNIEWSPRRVLLETSISLANDYLPIGTGFGTFGSYPSGENYSRVYTLYGINNIDGMREGQTYFLTDSFWPMIIGQFGYLGTFLYLICIVAIFKEIQRSSKLGKYIYISKIIAFTYLIISSTAEAAFVNPISIPLALVIGLNFDEKEKIQNE